MRKFICSGLLGVMALLTGCATIDFDYPRTESVTIENTEETRLGKRVAELSAVHPESTSGFYPLVDGIEALSARLLLAERAEVSVDTQYYLVKTDDSSLVFIHALLRAADRGVRVRLLIDDVFTKGYDVGLAALDSHPNFEVRIFNPFRRGAGGLQKVRLSKGGRPPRPRGLTRSCSGRVRCVLRPTRMTILPRTWPPGPWCEMSSGSDR